MSSGARHGATQLAYDAENRLIAETKGSFGATYAYDGDGRRVKKSQSGRDIVYVYVYDAFGILAAEYDSSSAGTAPCGTCYLSQDHLGSTRLITDEEANVIARHDYLPFGEEIPAGTAGRDGTFGLNASVNQKFTGQERDPETGLDFFEARFMSSLQGRFLSPDPFSAGADVGDPQSWNGYAYVRNNPLNRIDPTGTSWIGDFVDNLSNLLKNGCGSDFCVSGTGVSDIDTSSNAIAWYLTIGSILSPPQSSPSPSQPYKFTVTGTANPPKNEVPDNVCEFAGNAPDPSFWASAGKASRWDPVSAVLDLTKGFKIGGYLDA